MKRLERGSRERRGRLVHQGVGVGAGATLLLVQLLNDEVCELGEATIHPGVIDACTALAPRHDAWGRRERR